MRHFCKKLIGGPRHPWRGNKKLCVILTFLNLTFLKKRKFHGPRKQQAEPSRILWIDCAKVIGMYLVIMGHAGYAGSFGDFYGAFYMQMFFIISGFLEQDRPFKDTIINGIRTLIIPFVILYVLYSIAYSALIIVKFGIINDPFKIIKPFTGMFIGENGFSIKYGVFVCGPLWFVLALFWIKTINGALNIICGNNTIYYGFLVFLTPFIIIALKRFNINLPLSLDSAALSFPFFSMGKIAKRYSLVKEKTSRENIIISIMLFAVLYFTYKVNLGIDVNNTKFGDNIFLFYIIAAIGSFALINLSAAVYKKEIFIITLISKGMVIILASHYYFTTIIEILEIKIDNILLRLIIPLLIYIICIIPVVMAKKYFPIVMGGRK